MRIFLRKDVKKTNEFVHNRVIASKIPSLLPLLEADFENIEGYNREFIRDYIGHIIVSNFSSLMPFEAVTDALAANSIAMIKNVFNARPAVHNMLIGISNLINSISNVLKHFRLPGIIYAEWLDKFSEIMKDSAISGKARLFSTSIPITATLLRKHSPDIFIDNLSCVGEISSESMPQAAACIYDLIKLSNCACMNSVTDKIMPLIICGGQEMAMFDTDFVSYLSRVTPGILILSDSASKLSDLGFFKQGITRITREVNSKSDTLSTKVADITYHGKILNSVIDKVCVLLDAEYGEASSEWSALCVDQISIMLNDHKPHNHINIIDTAKLAYMPF